MYSFLDRYKHVLGNARYLEYANNKLLAYSTLLKIPLFYNLNSTTSYK